ncbi:Protein of unknown function [Bacillus cytotoxicus]|nr:Protein of unknown function [Bacillus cytotoxicus]
MDYLVVGIGMERGRLDFDMEK